MRGFFCFLVDSLLPVFCLVCGRDLAATDEPYPAEEWVGPGDAFASGPRHHLAGGSHNDDLSYAVARLGARPDWEAWRFNLAGTVALPWNLALTARGSGQLADEPLTPGEQFGLGGYDSLRALEMREVLGDRGWQFTLELRSPPLPGLNAAVVGFWDAGYISRKDAPLGTNGSEKAQDFGVGIRWQVLPSVSLSWDWAQLTDGTQFAPSGTARMYLLLRANY